QTPLVLLTGSEGATATSVKALLFGAASYVPRSVIARDLVVTVERILTLAGCRRRHGRLLDALRATECKFTVEDNDLGMIPVLVGHLADMCEEFAVCGNGNRLKTAMALEEAMSNGIIHGNLEVSSTLRDEDDTRFHDLIRSRRALPPYRERTLSVLGMFTTGEAQFTIRDEGPGFDHTLVPDPTQLENLDKPHGRGLYLIRAFMDDVSFNQQGNEIRLVKSAPRRDSPFSECPSKDS
ncbi:MAG: ATP-binding protein, partial [Planctomycetaceae bacterium]|nr:ATP-binding protein [Planctomycetaceae bacterium]